MINAPNIDPQQSRSSWPILALGFAILFVSGGARFALGLMLKPMTDDLDWGRSLMAAVSTLYMMVSACGQPLVGRLIDRSNPLGVVAVGILLSGMGLMLMGLVTSVWHAVLGYGIVFALGQAAASVTSVGVMVSRAFGRRRGLATSTAIAGSASGQLVLLSLLTSGLAWLGWRVAYGVLGAIHGLFGLGLLVFLCCLPRQRAMSSVPLHPVASAGHAVPPVGRAGWQIVLLIVLYTICGMQDFFVSTHVVAFATDHGVPPIVAGHVFALMGLMGLVGVMVSGVLADAYGPGLPTLWCFIVRVGLFGCIPLVHDQTSILVFALLYGATFLVTAPLTVLFAERAVGPARMGSFSGLLSMVHQIAGGIGALFGGSVFDRWGSYDVAFAVLLVLSVVATGVTWRLKDVRGATPLVAH